MGIGPMKLLLSMYNSRSLDDRDVLEKSRVLLKEEGRMPENRLLERNKIDNFVRFSSSRGKLPLRLLDSTFKKAKWLKLPKEGGISPTKLL